MRKSLSNKLEVFLHQNIQRIVRVSMTRVCEEGTQNQHGRRMFYNIPCVCNMIAARRLDFIGKAVCGPSDRNVDRMLRQYSWIWTSLPSQQRLHCQKSLPPICQRTWSYHRQIWLPQALDKGSITWTVLELIGNVPYWQTCYHSCLPWWMAATKKKPLQSWCPPPPQANNPFPPHPLEQTKQECQIPQQCQKVNKDQLPQHPHVPHRHANNGPRPCPLHRQMAVKITYLSKWGEASMIPQNTWPWTGSTGKGNITGLLEACMPISPRQVGSSTSHNWHDTSRDNRTLSVT